MKTMPYNEFVELVNQTAINFDWRYGQSLMNVLYDTWPEKYNEILGSNKDCYYNDTLFKDTLDYLQKVWS